MRLSNRHLISVKRTYQQTSEQVTLPLRIHKAIRYAEAMHAIRSNRVVGGIPAVWSRVDQLFSRTFGVDEGDALVDVRLRTAAYLTLEITDNPVDRWHGVRSSQEETEQGVVIESSMLVCGMCVAWIGNPTERAY